VHVDDSQIRRTEPGGVNFDAKVRRESFEPVDLFYAHIGGMDTFARGLKIAAAIRAEGTLSKIVKDRYSSWDSGIGAEIEQGKTSFASMETYMLKKGEVTPNQSPACIRRPVRAVVYPDGWSV